MKPVSQMSMEELAAYVCSKPGENSIETVLSGGSCVQIYSQGKYTSDDIDLIDRFNGGHTLIKKSDVGYGLQRAQSLLCA